MEDFLIYPVILNLESFDHIGQKFLLPLKFRDSLFKKSVLLPQTSFFLCAEHKCEYHVIQDCHRQGTHKKHQYLADDRPH